MKKKIILMAAAATLAVTAFAGSSLAYFQADGREVRQQINTPTLGITLVDGNQSDAPDSYTFENIMPGAKVSFDGAENKNHQLLVENDEEVTLYTRVTIKKYWGDGQGTEFEKDYQADPSLIELDPGNDWYVMNQDSETTCLYYKYPLEAGEVTDSILKNLTISPELKNEFTGKKIRMTVEADAVQFASAEDAILTEWGVYPVFNENGEILSIEE